MSGQLGTQSANLPSWREPREIAHRRDRDFVDHQIKHCIRAYGLRALLVAADNDRALVRSTRDPGIVLTNLRAQYGVGIEVCRVWWGIPQEVSALHLAWSATTESSEPTIRGLLASAQEYEITLTPDRVVQARACDLVEYVNLKFEHIRRTRQMRERLNQAYLTARQYRPSLQAREFERKLTLQLIYAIAQNGAWPIPTLVEELKRSYCTN